MNPKRQVALDRYFSIFDTTRELAKEFIREHKNPIEILILLCARLDALASDSAAPEESRKKAFVRFISNYSHKKDLINSVSVGNLYYELGYHRWLLDGMIPEPGRLHRFSRLNDPFLHLLEEAGLPLTLKDSEALVDTLMRVLKKEFRVVPGQPLKKPRMAGTVKLRELLIDSFKRTQLKRIAENLDDALKPLLESSKIGIILYEEFRSESIHGATIYVDPQRFFSETELYWRPLYSEYYGAFERVEFSAPFLLSLLENCIKYYRAALLGKGIVPPDIHFHVFNDDIFSDFEFLEEGLLPKGGPIRLKID